MTHQQCGTCGQPVHDVGLLCAKCSGRLRRDLLDIPDLLAELEATALRQVNTADGRGGDAVPWDQHARDAQHAIRNAVTTWARILLDDSARPPAGQTIALWLADQTGRIRLQPWAPDCRHDIRRVVAAGWRAIDRPEDRWYAGPCGCEIHNPDGVTECTTTLWAQIDQPDVTCPGCGYRWPVILRRDWLLSAAVDVIDTATTIAGAITLMTRSRISPAQIRKWHWRKRLKHAGRTDSGAWLYRVGDVLALVEQRDADRASDGTGHQFEHARFDVGPCHACPPGPEQDVGHCDWCGQWICEQHAGQPCPAAPNAERDAPGDDRELTAV